VIAQEARARPQVMSFFPDTFAAARSSTSRAAATRESVPSTITIDFETEELNAPVLRGIPVEDNIDHIVHVLGLHVPTVLKILNLKQDYVQINASAQFGAAQNKVELGTNPDYIGYRDRHQTQPTLRLVLSGDLPALLASEDGQPLVLDFELDTPRYYTYVPTLGQLDPFRSLYPLTLICDNVGLDNCWIQSCSFQPTLAIVKEDQEITSLSLSVSRPTTRAHLRLLDGCERPLISPRAVQIYAIFKFEKPKLSSE
jgi:hypothetical protein